ncbi:MAG: ribonuclease HI family protein [Elusimicrobiota bacterium]
MSSPARLVIYIDGACRFNPGPAGIGVAVYDEQGTLIAGISEAIGDATNNIAEWSAYVRALREAKRLGAKRLDIYTDSQLLARQVSGQYKIRNPHLQSLAALAMALRPEFDRVTVTSIPRERNKVADKLSKEAVF